MSHGSSFLPGAVSVTRHVFPSQAAPVASAAVRGALVTISAITARHLPHPPYELAARVGSLDARTAERTHGAPQSAAEDPWAFYDWLGATAKEGLEAVLSADRDLEGRRILDFGCGAGRILRQFVADDRDMELWGCDIDAPSIAWLEQNLSPRLRVFVNRELPPLPQPGEFFDVIYCVSVFTHLTRTWSDWLVELHRVLKPGGLLIATFMGEGQSQEIAGEPWDEDRVGMLILRPGQPWDLGGPMVLHSPWWIAAHWGRVFDVVSLQPHGFGASPAGTGQGIVVLAKNSKTVTPAALREPSDDPRETTALAHNVERLCLELEELRPRLQRLEEGLVSQGAHAAARRTPGRGLLSVVRRLARTARSLVAHPRR